MKGAVARSVTLNRLALAIDATVAAGLLLFLL
jgi:hypothetical protein